VSLGRVPEREREPQVDPQTGQRRRAEPAPVQAAVVQFRVRAVAALRVSPARAELVWPVAQQTDQPLADWAREPGERVRVLALRANRQTDRPPRVEGQRVPVAAAAEAAEVAPRPAELRLAVAELGRQAASQRGRLPPVQVELERV
jgi:hypothetical protein